MHESWCDDPAFRMGGEDGGEPEERFGVDCRIRVEEEHEFRRPRPPPNVAPIREAAVPAERNGSRAEACGECGRTIL